MGPEEYYGYQQQPSYTPQEDPSAKRRRILIGAGGLGAFILVLIIVLNMLLATPTIRPDYVLIAAQQAEIARVAELGVVSEDARRSTKNLAANVRSVSLTNVASLSEWAKDNFSQGALTRSELSSEENEDTTAALADAGAVNEYDETFEEAMLSLLQGGNRQIMASMDTFEAFPELQDILNEIGFNNQQLIESISSE